MIKYRVEHMPAEKPADQHPENEVADLLRAHAALARVPHSQNRADVHAERDERAEGLDGWRMARVEVSLEHRNVVNERDRDFRSLWRRG